MTITNIHEAKTNLSKLLAQVARGKKVFIAKAGKPVAILSPIENKKIARKPGALKGKIKIHKHFDELPTSFMKYFK